MMGERLFTEHPWRNQQAGLGVGSLWVVASLLVNGPAAWTESSAHYPLDGDARDASGNAHHGTPSGVEPGEDRFGNESGALLFQGTQDRIDLPHEVLDGLWDVSISFWLKTTKPGSQAILSAANRSNDNEHIVYLWDQRTIHFLSHGRHSHQSRNCVVGIPPIADGRWHHMVVVRNAAEGNAAFYVDGAGQTGRCDDLEYGVLTVEEGGLVLGQEQDRLGGDFDPNQVLDGLLDDLRIYDKVLSTAEVRTLSRMEGEEPLGPEGGLVAHYPLDGDARDASGNGYHGTSSGVEPGEDLFGNESGALLFQGTQDRIDLPHQVLDGLRDVSISFWLKTTNRGEQAIVSGANGSNDNEYTLYQMREDQFRLFSHGRFEYTEHECDVYVDPIADGGWHHIVWVRNASEGFSDFYVDGAGQKGICGHLEYRTLSVEDRGLVLGQEQDWLGGGFSEYRAFQGSLDDLWIYDRALTPAEVQALRAGGPVTFTAAMATPDFDGDGEIGLSDFFLFAEAFGGSDPRFDLDGSGTVDFTDFFLFSEQFGQPVRSKLLALAREMIGLPDSAQLQPNVPNPFNNSTWIPYRLAVPGHARLEIYNMLGQRVRILVDEFQAAGTYRPHWDARDQRGTAVAAGVYLARLVHPGGVHTRRLLYLE